MTQPLTPQDTQAWIHIDLARQQLQLRQGDAILFEATISSARNGPGEQNGSGCTPRGWHRIRARIGGGCAAGTVFIGRRPSGEIYNPELATAQPERDWILSRILWLSGLEPGRNRLGQVDTMRRYIYLHGCPDEYPMGQPLSHGCIRMRNADIIRLYDLVTAGTQVLIEA
jgi:hypothetical protein